MDSFFACALLKACNCHVLLQVAEFLFSVVTSFPKGFLFFISFIVYIAHYQSFRFCHFNILFVPVMAEPIKL